jgi:cell division protein FtsN
MSREYANKSRRQPKGRNSRVKPSRHPLPGWIWLVGGVFIGVLVTGLFSSYNKPAVPEPADTTVVDAVETQAEEAPRHQPRFDFYTLLQESEVVIPDENDTKPQPKPVIVPEIKAEPQPQEQTVASEPRSQETVALQPKPQQPAVAKVDPKPVAQPHATQPETERTVYVLQAGSFKSGADADSVRASLLLLNMQANIEKVPAGNNQTWHRVLVGPFTSKAELSAAKAILTRNGIDSIQLKRRM